MIDVRTATALVHRHVTPGLNVAAVRPLTGGMVNTVVEFVTNGQPASIVVKLADAPTHRGFRGEFDTLQWYRRNTDFPVPRPLAWGGGDMEFEGRFLLMEKVPGVHLGKAKLTPAGMERFQEQLADHLVRLHRRRRETYGSALEQGGFEAWLERFGPMIRGNFEKTADRFSSHRRKAVEGMLADLPAWLPEFHAPTLVHGDLWAANILVDDRDADRPVLTAFLDGGANYSEVEYELAYLRVFHTADEAFFRRYTREHALRDGFERRCRVYWLNTMMLHVWMFGDEYLPAAEGLADQIERLT